MVSCERDFCMQWTLYLLVSSHHLISSHSWAEQACLSDDRQAAVIWLCGLPAAWEQAVGLWHLCYWYGSLSHFSCPRETQASKFAPTEPALLGVALNINTHLRGPVNAWYREESEQWKRGACSSSLPCVWKGKVRKRAKETERPKGPPQSLRWLSTCCSRCWLWYSSSHSFCFCNYFNLVMFHRAVHLWFSAFINLGFLFIFTI